MAASGRRHRGRGGPPAVTGRTGRLPGQRALGGSADRSDRNQRAVPTYEQFGAAGAVLGNPCRELSADAAVGPAALQMGERAITQTHPPGIDRSVSPSGDPSGQRAGRSTGANRQLPAGDTGEALSDVDLVALCGTDVEAFGLLYDRYCDRIHRFVYSRLRDRTAAEDVTAEVFFKALKSIATYRSAVGPFSAWLYRIAGNAVIDYLRARRPTMSLELEMDSTDPAAPVEDQAIDRVEVAQVWKAIDQLSDAQRTAVVLRLERDLPIAEIAGHMNRSEGAVKLLLHRGMAALRERLHEADIGRGRR